VDWCSLDLRPGGAAGRARSETVDCYEINDDGSTGVKVCKFHQRIKSDGEPAGGGPDPKEILHNGELLYVGHGPCPCENPCR